MAEEKKSDQVKQSDVYTKWAELMSRVGYLQKDQRVQFQNTDYNAVTETAVLKNIRPVMVELGLIMYPTNGRTYMDKNKNGTMVTTAEITYVVCDPESGTTMTLVGFGQGSDSQDKGAGKAMTYAGKYALLKGLLIVTGDDPDMTASDKITHDEEKDISDFDDKFHEVSTLLRALLSEKKIDTPTYDQFFANMQTVQKERNWDRLKKAEKVFKDM